MLKPKTAAAPAAVDTPGRAGPKLKLKGGERLNVYLDADTIAYATELGDGKLSPGLRKAVKMAKGSK